MVGTVLTAVLALASVALLLVGGGPPLPRQAGSSDAVSTGHTVFLANGCHRCHVLDDLPGNAQIGPDLTPVDRLAAFRVEGLSAEEYVRQSLREPQAFMVPGYGPEMPTLELTEEEVEDLIELLLAG
jgi:cytochrome c1